MALKRPTPKKLSEAEQIAITVGSAGQTGKASVQKSYDPDYPVFDVPINQKLLVYIPNHTVMDTDGSLNLRMDKFAAHPVIDGRTFTNVRCSGGYTSETLGYDGSCPLCDGVSECWDLYRNEYDDIARSKGVDPHAPESKEILKNDSIELLNRFAIKQAEVWYTFPIVVIDCEEKDGQLTINPRLDANGRITGKPMFYSIRERTFKEKWEAGYDSIEDAEGNTPTNPAGLWAVLNFTYQPKNGKADKMGSARALKVTFKTMNPTFDQWATYFDQLTEGWTPEKAQEVVVLDALRSMDELKEATDSLLRSTREKLAMYQLSNKGTTAVGTAVAAPVASSAEDTLANFGGAAPVAANLTGEMPSVGVE